MMFKKSLLWLMLLSFTPVQAANVDVKVILFPDLQPGIYGRVELGAAPPPPLVYVEPVIIIPPAPNVRLRPIYLSVPPGHAKHWARHCHKYNACGIPVYFVKTSEYDVKGKGKGKGKHKGKDHHHH